MIEKPTSTVLPPEVVGENGESFIAEFVFPINIKWDTGRLVIFQSVADSTLRLLLHHYGISPRGTFGVGFTRACLWDSFVILYNLA